MLCLWKLCPKARCRRAHACSADPDFCVERFAALVSEDVHVALDVLNDIEPVTEDTIEREIAKLTPEDLERIRKAFMTRNSLDIPMTTPAPWRLPAASKHTMCGSRNCMARKQRLLPREIVRPIDAKRERGGGERLRKAS